MSPRPARALVIGASGFLGSRLLSLGPRDVDLVGTGHSRPVRPGAWREAILDVTSATAVSALIEKERPGLVFYTSYDKARRDVTVDGARIAARAAYAVGGRFVFFSTDLLFDGTLGNYSEAMTAEPIMPYGQMKLEAEAAVKDAVPGAVILRPSLMWGESGITLRPAFECDALVRGQVVEAYADEWRSPVHVDDVARAAWDLGVGDASDLFHLGGPERLSRYEIAQRLCTIHNFDASLVQQAQRPEDRPADTSLDSTRLTELLEWSPQPLGPPTLQGLEAGGEEPGFDPSAIDLSRFDG